MIKNKFDSEIMTIEKFEATNHILSDSIKWFCKGENLKGIKAIYVWPHVKDFKGFKNLEDCISTYGIYEDINSKHCKIKAAVKNGLTYWYTNEYFVQSLAEIGLDYKD